MPASHPRLLSIPLFLVLFGTSCLVPPPSCLHRTWGPPLREHFVTLYVFSDPIEGAERNPTGPPVPGWFRHATVIRIDVAEDGSGSLSVSSMGARYLSCSRVSAEEVDDLSRSWQAVLKRVPRANPSFRFMDDPFADGWRPDGPLLSLSFGPPSRETLGLMWDVRSTMPEVLNSAVVATMQVACRSNRDARDHLLHGFPQLKSQLECP